jgi:hypothetical protein
MPPSHCGTSWRRPDRWLVDDGWPGANDGRWGVDDGETAAVDETLVGVG